MLLLYVPVGDVHMLQRGVVVLVGVGGQQVSPVLPPVQVVRHVIMLVAVLQGLVLMMPLLSGQSPHLFSRTDVRTTGSNVHRAMGPHKQKRRPAARRGRDPSSAARPAVVGPVAR